MNWLAAQLNARYSPNEWRVVGRGKLRADSRAAAFTAFSSFRSAESSAHLRLDESGQRRRGHDHAADSSLSWRRKCGSRFFGCSRCANSGGASWATNIFANLQEIIPYSWLLDPTPLPQHAVIPRLEIHDWREAGKFSQKERELLLKVSGFSPLGWGSRGVSVGQDLPQAEWQRLIEEALQTSRRRRESCSVFTKRDCRSAVLGLRNRRSENDARPGPALSVLLCRERSGALARRARDHRARRQKTSARNARRHHGADDDCAEKLTTR